jgi:Golgi nucleoside diphosphatase
MSRSREGAKSLKNSNPDKGPKMIEGAHKFDKGYESDNETFAPTQNMYPGAKERGNEYMKLNNEWQKKDAGKLSRQKFSKIA